MSSADHSTRVTAPLAVRMRPTTLDEFVGQSHLLRAGAPLRQLAEGSTGALAAASAILWGPPGTGKTTLAHVIARSSGSNFIELSAITAGVKDVRDAIERARADADLYARNTLLFLDEIHRFSKAQQDALLPAVENGWVTLVAATTENPSFSVIQPLLSRSLLFTLEPLSDDDIRTVITRALEDPRGLASEYALSDEAKDAIVRLSQHDARQALTLLEAAAASAKAAASGTTGKRTIGVNLEHVEAASQRAALRYDRDGDQHYDVIGAFIKSIRGSDADAAVHYLARMLEAGEDVRFIARRLIISAAEDIGLADPHALPIAVAAAEAVAKIGMPEGRIPLAEATIYLALAPKSNAAYLAVDAAIADVRAGRFGAVPDHLRDGSVAASRATGAGAGYRYPHDDPAGVLLQQYLPNELRDAAYYQPTERGSEGPIRARFEKLKAIIRGD